MLRSVILAIPVLLISGAANATCVGSAAIQSCFDSGGNSYTVNRLGNSTFMSGFNGQTGSTWSQNSTTIGGTTFHNGMTNGRSWNMIDQRMGGMRSMHGTDSQGRSFQHFGR